VRLNTEWKRKTLKWRLNPSTVPTGGHNRETSQPQATGLNHDERRGFKLRLTLAEQGGGAAGQTLIEQGVSCGPGQIDDPLVEIGGGESQGLADILILELGVLPPQFFPVRVNRQGLEHPTHGQAQVADAGLPVQAARITGDALQTLHDSPHSVVGIFILYGENAFLFCASQARVT